MRNCNRNLFRAFDYYDESDVYDALASSADGKLLEEFYLKMRKSLEIKEQGGAVAHIDAVNLLSGTLSERSANRIPLETPDFAYHCKWTLQGTVEHWGHIHERTNTYEAIFNVENIDGCWKFTDYESVSEEQGIVRRSIRKF